MTTSRLRGMSHEMFRRLCCRAPRIRRKSIGGILPAGLEERWISPSNASSAGICVVDRADSAALTLIPAPGFLSHTFPNRIQGGRRLMTNPNSCRRIALAFAFGLAVWIASAPAAHALNLYGNSAGSNRVDVINPATGALIR